MAQTLEHNQVVTQVVPITVPSCDVDVTVIQQLDDEPNDVGGLTAAELKANAAVKSYINDELIPAVVGADATEQARAAAEAERVANEIERVSNETTRVNAETTRGNNETARQSAETARGNNETTRVSNETIRQNNEEARQNNEEARQNNEEARVLAEAARENAETGYVAQCAASAEDAEAWAVGKRGGVNVGEGDPAYHNNALYWKEQAQQAAGTGDMLASTYDPQGKAQDIFAYADAKSNKAVAFTVTLSASGWSGKAQTVSDARFLTGNYAYSVAPDSGSFAAYGESVIYADNVTMAGKMQFHCGEVPTADLTVNILRMEVSA